ncbi:melanoma-associated antigen D2 [Anopheles aquasalis]|uniref:melanoma-associated antigen D2 n=1 Tax=Anopheles aquasalis TaxID=42839 RepID=UPI00215A3991|nr:melanoma-associated antigen D2 [Anopheles aquasalis]
MPRPSQSRASASQPLSISQVQASQSSEAVVDITSYVTAVVKAILNLSCNKAIIKRADLVNIALKGNGRLIGRVLQEAVVELKDIYGYELIEVEKNKTMILCSTLPCGSMDELNDADRRRYIFLYLILGYIFMKNGSVPETIVWEFLETLGIEEQQEHNYFGDVKKMYDSFFKQLYLARTKQVLEGLNDDVMLISWGVRSKHEVSKKEILEGFCKVMNRNPVDFKTQYIEANEHDHVEDD